MSPDSWKRIVVMTVIGLGSELIGSFPLLFAPGWANGWPFGLTIHVVWSAGMVLLLFVFLMTAAACLGAGIGYVASRFGAGMRFGRPAYAVWLVIAAGSALWVGVWAYHETHAATLRMWPNGYPNKRASMRSQPVAEARSVLCRGNGFA